MARKANVELVGGLGALLPDPSSTPSGKGWRRLLNDHFKDHDAGDGLRAWRLALAEALRGAGVGRPESTEAGWRALWHGTGGRLPKGVRLRGLSGCDLAGWRSRVLAAAGMTAEEAAALAMKSAETPKRYGATPKLVEADWSVTERVTPERLHAAVSWASTVSSAARAMAGAKNLAGVSDLRSQAPDGLSLSMLDLAMSDAERFSRDMVPKAAEIARKMEAEAASRGGGGGEEAEADLLGLLAEVRGMRGVQLPWFDRVEEFLSSSGEAV